MKYTVKIGEQSFPISDKESKTLNARALSSDSLHIISNNKNFNTHLVSIDIVNRKMTINVNGSDYHIEIKDEYDDLLHEMGLDVVPEQRMTDVKAPMPGLVLEVMVKVGDNIVKGDNLDILEAMKMENVLQAEGDGVVKSIEVNKGDTVDKTQVLIEME